LIYGGLGKILEIVASLWNTPKLTEIGINLGEGRNEKV